ncbi:dihydrodipicolinate synthase family protein [Paenibacillus oenotherae]|uniref:Dihydrodipicolinate synthase family protein n=1 Tax=Paenibacillus oenotherae TaxID=1435645 RepID=A0ABS7D236_9BACL|nr:dihydrodipicolinate synthase family protein [Paenibacillus oenotherae]MBW7474005.1 dihydrodipicolinate synthase family protein [Paenibacillus oenotherae]
MTYAIEDLKGIVPPLFTPLNEDETLDEGSFVKLIHHCLEGGVHGLFPMGSAGEGTNVSREVWERANVLCLQEAGGKIPVYCGVIDVSTPRVIEGIKRLEQHGAEYVVATPHFYMNTSCQEEIIRHFEAISSKTAAKMLVYNIPALTQVNILPETVLALSRIDNVVGYKDTCGNWDQHFKTLSLLADTDMRIFCGGEELCGPSLLFGTHGSIAGLANLYPKVFAEIYEAAQQGDAARTKELQQQIISIKRICGIGSSWLTGMKYVMHRMNLGNPKASMPVEPLLPEEKRQIDALLEELSR